MARFSGVLGYAHSETVRPGVREEVITERKVKGTVLRDVINARQGDEVLPSLSTANSFDIVADAYARDNISAMRYVKWMGTRWTIRQVENRRPRLHVRIGGVYNGPTPKVPDTP